MLFVLSFCVSVPAQTQTAWQLLDDGDPSYANNSLAYDSVRNVAVLTTPAETEGAPNTWELVGNDWVRRWVREPTPWSGDFVRSVFDSTRNVVVLYGRLSSTTSSDTWEWDGSSWTVRTTATIPPARAKAGLAYDSARGRVVLFGGLNPVTVFPMNDTWEYDGNDWTLISTPISPGARDGMGMCYDEARGVTVMFGGGTGVGLNDTWEYDGTNWTRRFPSSTPPGRFGPAMACDAARERVVLFGGGPTALEDTWEYDGTNWDQISTQTAPPSRAWGRAVYDSERAAIVMYGGSPDNSALNDTWAYDGTNWTQIATSGLPLPRKSHGLAYDPSRQITILYGGLNLYQNARLWDTWHYSDRAWSEDTLAGMPNASNQFPIVYDSVSDRTVGFSGSGNLSPQPDLHEYAGVLPSWSSTPMDTPSDPPPRDCHGWVTDSGISGIYLFGGFESGTKGDTWRLDGLQWTELFPTNSPSARSEMAMDYDRELGRIVLHGGSTSGSYSGRQSDTWFFDGSEWTQYESTSPPGARFAHSLTYDSSRGVSVLFGDGPALEGITWEFDGSMWTARPTAFQPDTHRCWFGQTYDEKNEVVLLFGGRSCLGDTYFNDTWAYGPDPDGDGIVGGLDNCQTVSNDDQANLDNDVAGDACDCASADPGAFAVPVEVTDLTVDGNDVSWNEQASSAGDDTVYDLVTGDLSALFSNGDFSAEQTAMPALWSSWQEASSKGSFLWDRESGAAKNGSARANLNHSHSTSAPGCGDKNAARIAPSRVNQAR